MPEVGGETLPSDESEPTRKRSGLSIAAEGQEFLGITSKVRLQFSMPPSIKFVDEVPLYEWPLREMLHFNM